MKRLLPVLIGIIAIAAAACSSGTDEPAAEPVEAPPSAAVAPAPSEPAEPAPAAPAPAPEVARAEPAPAAQPEVAPTTIDEAPTGVFRRLWADPPTLDPHLTSDTTSAGIVVEIFGGLVALNTQLQLVPDIAEKWTVEDGMVYTFTLRPNVKFHNGKPVTAQDFKWSLERSGDPKTASPVADTYLNDIVGFDDYFEGRSPEISGIKVIDDRTLQITIDGPKAYFLAKLTYPTAYVLDQEVVESGGRSWWIDNPVGTGPFKLDEYRIGERIVLERYSDYHREPAGVERTLRQAC